MKDFKNQMCLLFEALFKRLVHCSLVSCYVLIDVVEYPEWEETGVGWVTGPVTGRKRQKRRGT